MVITLVDNLAIGPLSLKINPEAKRSEALVWPITSLVLSSWTVTGLAGKPVKEIHRVSTKLEKNRHPITALVGE